jgi:hypothetical protein
MEEIFSEGRIFLFAISSKAMITEHLKLQVPQCMQASSSMAWRVALSAGDNFSFPMTPFARRLMELAKIWNILLKGR